MHIVQLGWDRMCSGLKTDFSNFVTLCQSWMRSWMLPNYCENDKEYQLSKLLFYSYIRDVDCELSSNQKDMVLKFVCDSVEVVEQNYCFFHQKHI